LFGNWTVEIGSAQRGKKTGRGRPHKRAGKRPKTKYFEKSAKGGRREEREREGEIGLKKINRAPAGNIKGGGLQGRGENPSKEKSESKDYISGRGMHVGEGKKR